ncbi:c-type cytochrome [Labilibaculum sp. DW002]|uniref:C-type cytochrome n=1 Tax=Paralabilibaculum antarcticum TaxID=2912572 RepID=A0ABT5VS15_9BACT|nr:cbb3-type cytochrome c oxidase N-terminal domain-containing protein [Labilibaculum sp. DW002]MDE5418218.1 c-type cytochrome [Labilibaculum sp. DW002]
MEKKDKFLEENAHLISDHDYDGIQELNNPMPTWWRYLFYVTIVFSAVYMFRYHVFGDDLQIAEYEKEMALAEANKPKPTFDESSLVLMKGAKDLEAGKALYDKNCVACHALLGEGNAIGPNLTDDYWLNGGSLEDVYKIIKVGKPLKGMLAWQNQLSPEQMLQVSSYTMSLQGTNPPNAREAQGELIE